MSKELRVNIKQQKIIHIQVATTGKLFWQLSFVTPRHDPAPRVGGRVSGLR
jgi:hypothetical protein